MIAAVIFTILALYILLIGSYIYGFNKAQEFHIPDITPRTKFTIIVAFRNEAENLPSLIESIKNLNYKKAYFEVIFVNDESEDFSVEIIYTQMQNTNINFLLINRDVISKSPKKDAINTAIKHAKNEWIITTDADCNVPTFWLDSFDAFIQNYNYKLIAGPVSYAHENTPLSLFQTLDFNSLMGTTIGSFGLNKPYMANGANLAYQAIFYRELNGYEGNSHIASGDDVFLLQKAVKYNSKLVGFLKSQKAIVTTKPVNTLKKLIMQRMRWASKSSGYTIGFAKFTGLIVLFTNLLAITVIGLALMAAISWNSCIYIWIIKMSIDFIILFKTIRFLDQYQLIKSYFWSALIHPFFISYVAVSSLIKGYEWKDRRFKK